MPQPRGEKSANGKAGNLSCKPGKEATKGMTTSQGPDMHKYNTHIKNMTHFTAIFLHGQHPDVTGDTRDKGCSKTAYFVNF